MDLQFSMLYIGNQTFNLILFYFIAVFVENIFYELQKIYVITYMTKYNLITLVYFLRMA